MNLKEIARLNALEGSKVFGFTKFSDMLRHTFLQEFADRMLMKPGILGECRSRQRPCINRPQSDKPIRYRDSMKSSFDWRKENVVKPIQDQKQCSGCWAFSIVGVMESMAAIRGLDHESRSIQELIDCSTYNQGCTNGSVILAVDYLCDTELQMVTEHQYPLRLVTGNCNLPEKYSGRRLQQYIHQCNISEDLIVNETYYHGPLIVAVDATNWMHYIGGVIRWSCYPYVLNHVVQIVGYDGYGRQSEIDPPYYIVRNSFGEDFGDHGYVKIAIGQNVCGIAEEVTQIDVI